MKKLVVVAVLLTAFIFQFCSSSKKAHKAPRAVTYTADVQPLISVNCTPCHIEGKGNKKVLSNFTAARDNIDDMIARIEKNPNDRGFMPFKHPKLSDSTIQVFVKWKTDGLKEN